jgi:hypothetical protein
MIVIISKETIPQNYDIEYRDYLLDVVDVHITKQSVSSADEFPPFITDQDIRAQTLQNLKEKFKQNFSTTDINKISANHVAIEILKDVLVEDLHFIKGNIPVQGNLSERQYVDVLIDFSTQTLEALSTTYRIDLCRSDLEETTHVRENILTLQKYLRDDKFVCNNPFFFYKDEWRLRFLTPFFPENHYAFKTGLFASNNDRNYTLKLIDAAISRKNYLTENQLSPYFEEDFITRLKILLDLDSNLINGHHQFIAQEYGLAKDSYIKAVNNVHQLINNMYLPVITQRNTNVNLKPKLDTADVFRASLDPNNKVHFNPYDSPYKSYGGKVINISSGEIPSNFPYTKTLITRLAERYDHRDIVNVYSIGSLKKLEDSNLVMVPSPINTLQEPYQKLIEALFNLHDDLVSLMPHVMFLMLPVCLAEVAASTGDFITASNYYAQVVREHLLRTSLKSIDIKQQETNIDANGELPWSYSSCEIATLNGKDYPYLNKKCEIPFLLLLIGNLYLDWAEQLYRTDQEPGIFRARELYKAVLQQYGIPPLPMAGLTPLPKLPAWGPSLNNTPSGRTVWIPSPKNTSSGSANWGPSPQNTPPGSANWGPSPGNPAIQVQQIRAQIGIKQIDAGLNYYGYSYNFVPLLRYRPLVEAAQHFSNLAHHAQSDFLSYKEHAENGEIDLIHAHNAVAAATIRVEIENQRILQANDYMEQAQLQVMQIQEEIKAKESEIADHNSFFGQLTDFFGGIKDFFSPIISVAPDKVKNYVKSDYWAAFGFGSPSTEAPAGLGVVGGMILFAVGGEITMNGMANSANQRVNELQQLETLQLPMAMATLDIRSLEVDIAKKQYTVAILEAKTAQEILNYSQLHTLNVEMWANMASTMKSVLRRYLELGTMYGWLAERALSYTQDSNLRLIRFDYFKSKLQGMLGADALQADLSLLENEYNIGLQYTIPIKWKVSLLHDFPLQFGQLKIKGNCSFMTSTTALKLAYPGTFNHRIRTIEVSAIIPVIEQPPRGLLSNSGISHLTGHLGDEHILIRTPDVYPLSEFKFKEDRLVYELDENVLTTFEGSGLDTSWFLEFPAASNLGGLGSLADICITFYLQARFSPTLKTKLVNSDKLTVTRSALFSARKIFSKSLESFLVSNKEILTFTITKNMLPINEKNRHITNITIFFLAKDLPTITCRLASDKHLQPVTLTSKDGLIYISAEMDLKMTGSPEQNWTLTIPSINNPNLDRKVISDIIFGIEYTAQPMF